MLISTAQRCTGRIQNERAKKIFALPLDVCHSNIYHLTIELRKNHPSNNLSALTEIIIIRSAAKNGSGECQQTDLPRLVRWNCNSLEDSGKQASLLSLPSDGPFSFLAVRPEDANAKK